MSDDFLLGVITGLVLMLVAIVIARVRAEDYLRALDRAANQRIAMLEGMGEAAGGSIDTYRELLQAMEEIDLPDHAKALQRGKTASEIYPPILWGVAKAVEGVE